MNIFAKILYIFRDRVDLDFLGYAVDENDFVRKIESVGEDNSIEYGEKITVDELPEDTDDIPYGQWQGRVFSYNPRRTAAVFAALFPFFLIGYFAILIWVFPRPAIGSTFFCLMLVVMFRYLSTTGVRKASIILSHPSGRKYLKEEKWWSDKHKNFPEETKITRSVISGSGDTITYRETTERVIWLDARNQYVKMLPEGEEQEIQPDSINASNIIGVEALNNSAYNFAKLKTNISPLERNLPYLGIFIISLIGLFFATNKIMAILDVTAR